MKVGTPQQTPCKRLQNVPERKQVASQVQSGPQALGEWSGPCYDSILSYWRLCVGWGTVGVFFTEWPPISLKHRYELHSEAIRRLGLPNSSSFPICSHGNSLTCHVTWNSQCQGYSSIIDSTRKAIAIKRQMLPKMDKLSMNFPLF